LIAIVSISLFLYMSPEVDLGRLNNFAIYGGSFVRVRFESSNDTRAFPERLRNLDVGQAGVEVTELMSIYLLRMLRGVVTDPERVAQEYLTSMLPKISRFLACMRQGRIPHQCIMVVFCQLALATGRPWNDSDEGVANRLNRVRNFYSSVNLIAYDPIYEANLPVMEEVPHKAINAMCNQLPNARREWGREFLQIATQPSANNPDSSILMKTTAKFLQHSGQTSFIALLEGILAKVPNLIAHPEFAEYGGRLNRCSRAYNQLEEPARPFLCYLGLSGFEDISNKSMETFVRANAMFLLFIQGRYRNLRTTGADKAHHLATIAHGIYRKSIVEVRTMSHISGILALHRSLAGGNGVEFGQVASLYSTEIAAEKDNAGNDADPRSTRIGFVC